MSQTEIDRKPKDEAGLGLADPRSRIYLHCLDVHHYGRALLSNRVPAERIEREGRRAFRLSVLAADRVFLPASTYFEGQVAQKIIGEHLEFCELGLVCISAGEESVEDHREGKIPQYPDGVPGGGLRMYSAMPRIPPPPYIQKPGSSSRQRIEIAWQRALEGGGIGQLLAMAGGRHGATDAELAWARVPDLLEGRAFVPSHASELLTAQGVKVPKMAVCRVVEATYIDGYADSLGALIVGDLVYLASPFELTAEAAFSYAKAAQALKVLDVLAVLDHANVNELLRLKSSSAWQELWPILRHGGRLDEKAERLAREARKVAEGHHRFPRMGRLDCQIGVVTALPEEYVAMKRMLVGAVSTKVPGDTNEYTVGEIEARRNGRRIGSHRVALTLTKRTGTESAATTATNLLRSFPVIRLVLMVGIACGIPNPSDPDKHVRLGDIVVSDRQGIVDPTSGVAEAGGVKHRELILPPGAALTQAVNLLEAEELERGERPWQARIEQLIADHEKFKRPGPSTDVLLDANLEKVDHPIDKRRRGRARQPLVFRGPIGSSNLLSRDVGFREELAAKHGLRAIEMEGAGIANAAWDRSQPYGVIRASCDYGDPSKNDRWHHYAAGAAAAYAACAIARIAPCDLRDE